jgi:hypothetical protein
MLSLSVLVHISGCSSDSHSRWGTPVVPIGYRCPITASGKNSSHWSSALNPLKHSCMHYTTAAWRCKNQHDLRLGPPATTLQPSARRPANCLLWDRFRRASLGLGRQTRPSLEPRLSLSFACHPPRISFLLSIHHSIKSTNSLPFSPFSLLHSFDESGLLQAAKSFTMADNEVSPSPHVSDLIPTPRTPSCLQCCCARTISRDYFCAPCPGSQRPTPPRTMRPSPI